MTHLVFLAAAACLFFGGCTYVILLFVLPEEALTLATFAGSAFGLILYGYLVLHSRRMDRIYSEFAKTLPEGVLLQTNGNFRIDNGRVRNGNLYIYADLIVVASLDEKPHFIERIPRDRVEFLRLESGLLNLSIRDGSTLSFMLPDIRSVETDLRNHNWL